jgi:hypothetical protein
MATPKLSDDTRILIMEQLDKGLPVSIIVEQVSQKIGIPDSESKRCVSAIKSQHTKGYRPRVKSKSRIGQVYFIQGEKTKNIKIGFSTDPNDRLRQHQTGSGEELLMLACVEGNQELETEIQRRFDSFRVHGEWFSPSDELIEFINSLN